MPQQDQPNTTTTATEDVEPKAGAMTYRQRREARADRLDDWAEGRESKAAAAYEQAHEVMDAIPSGQPILVGHHSERVHRRALDRVDQKMGTSVQHTAKAKQMRQTAGEIRAQADQAVYSDDPDAITALRARVQQRTTERDEMKAANAAYRREHRVEFQALNAIERDRVLPYATFTVTNLSATIRRDAKRLARLEHQAEHGQRDRHLMARFAGTCQTCGAELEKGQMIRYSRSQGARCYPACKTHGEGREG